MTRKYGLKRELENLPVRDSRRKRLELASRMGVSVGRVNQLIYARVDSNTTMSGVQLKVASEVLDCTIDDLLAPYEEAD